MNSVLSNNEMTNQIWEGDSLKLLPKLPDNSADFILTDPPYITRYRSRDGRSVPNDNNDAWLKPSFAEMHRVLKPNSFAVSFYGWPRADRFQTAFRRAGFRIVGHLVFPKPYSSNTQLVNYRHETAYLLAKGNPKPQAIIGDVIDWSYSGNKYHPTEKPLCVLTSLIAAFTPAGGLVLDPFAGSGSTLIAARALGHNYLGIELDAKYYAIACDRLNLTPCTSC
ncbi:MAG: DNA methylase [Nitrospira sp. WS110]|nr:DNA methylase [Nitrospira sp. WS110]